ncbi:MAG: radical SAM protein [Candidatus Omnitrophica bacterium]|nr:radical SAM protein [Candidatus Omnitrophota bacterium]
MEVALVEVKSRGNDYVAKEMGGGLGRRLKLKGFLRGGILNYMLRARFSAPPILLAQLAGIFKARLYRVSTYYTSNAADIADGTDLCIALTSMVDYRNELNFIKELKSYRPNLKVIALGSFATAMPEVYQEYADFVIIGEPDSAIMEILSKGLPREKLIFSQELNNLNELPRLDWEPFILNKRYALRPFSKELGVSIQKSRGCSMTCNYCPYAAFYGKVRNFNDGYVIETIKYYVKNFNIRYFMFRDPNFGENKKELLSFMNALIISGLKINWSCEARLDTFSFDDLKTMRSAGLSYLITGIESSNAQLLHNNTRRSYKKEDAAGKVALLEKIGVVVQANYIYGFPNETEESVHNTLAYAKNLNSMFASFHIFTPQPGTSVFNDFKDKLFQVDWQDFNYSRLVWKHDNLSKEFLEGMFNRSYIEYYFRLKWAAKHFNKLIRIF